MFNYEESLRVTPELYLLLTLQFDNDEQPTVTDSLLYMDILYSLLEFVCQSANEREYQGQLEAACTICCVDELLKQPLVQYLINTLVSVLDRSVVLDEVKFDTEQVQWIIRL